MGALRRPNFVVVATPSFTGDAPAARARATQGAVLSTSSVRSPSHLCSRRSTQPHNSRRVRSPGAWAARRPSFRRRELRRGTTRPLIRVLLGPSRPTAVARLVTAVVVNTVECQALGAPAHVRVERLKRVAPGAAHRDAATAVVRPVAMLRIRASTTSVLPRPVSTAARRCVLPAVALAAAPPLTVAALALEAIAAGSVRMEARPPPGPLAIRAPLQPAGFRRPRLGAVLRLTVAGQVVSFRRRSDFNVAVRSRAGTSGAPARACFDGLPASRLSWS